MDIRKILTPSSLREYREMAGSIADFQDMDDKGKAGKLLEQKRLLVNAGRIRGDLDHPGNDWALAQTITSIAVRLDPEVSLQEDEAPFNYENDQHLVYNAVTSMTHCEFSGDEGAEGAALYLLPNLIHQGAIYSALEVIIPGTSPNYAEVETGKPLPGTYLIGRDSNNEQDRFIAYHDDYSEAGEWFRAACKHYGNEELTDEEQSMANRVRKLWGAHPFSQFELQNFDGEVLRHHDVGARYLERPDP